MRVALFSSHTTTRPRTQLAQSAAQLVQVPRLDKGWRDLGDAANDRVHHCLHAWYQVSLQKRPPVHAGHRLPAAGFGAADHRCRLRTRVSVAVVDVHVAQLVHVVAGGACCSTAVHSRRGANAGVGRKKQQQRPITLSVSPSPGAGLWLEFGCAGRPCRAIAGIMRLWRRGVNASAYVG